MVCRAPVLYCMQHVKDRPTETYRFYTSHSLLFVCSIKRKPNLGPSQRLSGPDLCVASLRTVWPLRRTMGRGLIFLSLVAATAAFHVSVARPSLGISGAAEAARAAPLVSLHATPMSRTSALAAALRMRLPAPRATAAEEEGGDPPGTSLLAYSAFGFIFASGIFCVVLNYILWGFRMAIENLGLNWWQATDVTLMRAKA